MDKTSEERHFATIEGRLSRVESVLESFIDQSNKHQQETRDQINQYMIAQQSRMKTDWAVVVGAGTLITVIVGALMTLSINPLRMTDFETKERITLQDQRILEMERTRVTEEEIRHYQQQQERIDQEQRSLLYDLNARLNFLRGQMNEDDPN